MPDTHAPLAIGDLPAPARSAAAALGSELARALGSGLHALYLYGAVTFPESEGGGDLDYHAIMSGPMGAQERAAYQAARDRLAGVPGCDELDGWVISLEGARGSEPPLHLIRPELRDMAWALHRAHWLAGRCVVLHGPDPDAIVTAPRWAEQRAGLEAELEFLRAVGPKNDAFAVLNACRILRSLAEKDVVQSKFGSAAWALEHLPAELGQAIQAGMSTYRGTATAVDAQALAAARPRIEALASASLSGSFVPDDRDRLKTTFNSVASRYHQARPAYPSELYDALVQLATLRPGDHLVEVGAATGKATIPLAQRGFAITCIELGSDLAAQARHNLAEFPAVEVVNDAFENWRPPPQATFALVFAATAWHWIDPQVRYQKAWQLLRPGGHLAFWSASHVFPADGDPFFREIQDVYDEIGEALPADLPDSEKYTLPADLPDEMADIAQSGLFTDIVARHFDWEIIYTADQYISLLDTFSGHIAMAGWQRDRLYSEIRRRLALRPDGRLRRHWGAVLNVARRKWLDAPGETR